MVMDKNTDSPLSAVPASERQHWIVPASIFGGLEFAVPVIMVGATLAGSFSISNVFWILVVGLVIIQWIGNALQGYLGAKTGRPSSVIARSAFGSIQARFIVGLALVVLNVGWFGINTSVAGNALSAMFGIDYTENWIMWAIITLIAGLLFALPAVLGYNSMKWTDYVAVPAGILLISGGVYYALRGEGWDKILSWNPDPSITFFGAISLVLGANVAQWLIASDYTRYSKPTLKDQTLIPLGIVAIGMLFFLTGAVMSVGVGNPDIVAVMQDLGFPFWGFLILWIALWTSQLVASYSIGLAASNMLNVDTSKGRAILTVVGSVLGVVLSIAGILNYFMDFLIIMAVIYPSIAAVMFADFFFIRKQEWVDNQGWNWIATIAILAGSSVGYLTEYVVKIGIPALQSLVISGIVYLLVMKIKSQVKPDHFTNSGYSKQDLVS
ncbi:permease [Virgibacillus dakarensis]|uniref:Cytosine permease n=1 Tax=Lentibacillus populi TaxID=1827502 RepID=A0A9W5TX37_9BACI|nr:MULTISPECIES: cytosine permease [Bacillaceae]MTW84493.1 permease [Virgibacillus dakarensis]GGB42353.1 cytosine permease [Lentibacillus populi]